MYKRENLKGSSCVGMKILGGKIKFFGGRFSFMRKGLLKKIGLDPVLTSI